MIQTINGTVKRKNCGINTYKNMKFRKIVEQVEELSISSYAKPHQITIDVIEELISHEAIIGSCAYKVNNLMEVMNPEYHYDIEVLTELLNILTSTIRSLKKTSQNHKQKQQF